MSTASTKPVSGRRRLVAAAMAAFSLVMGGASPAIAGPGYATAGLVYELNPREYGLDFSIPGAGNPMPCGIAERFRLQLAAANYEGLVSIIVTAAVQKRTFRVDASGCDTDGASVVIAAIVPTI